MQNPIPVIDVYGDARNVGRIHAQKTQHVATVVENNVIAARERYGAGETRDKITAIRDTLAEHSPDTLGQIAGMAEVYGLDESDLLVSVLQTYFEGVRRAELLPDQGCSTYTYVAPKGAVLVKNRDTGITFRDAQTILRVKEDTAHSWVALSTAGAPGVHSAGMNEHGLCIADTHVPSADTGPGLPRFSMMMEMLKHASTVQEARDYYERQPSMGYGNLILVDPSGDKLVIECGYAHSSYITTDEAFLTATNHFVSDELAGACLDEVNGPKWTETRERKRILSETVAADGDQVLADPAYPVSQHVDHGPGSLCVHSDTSPTIATIVMDPVGKRFGVSHGNPCEGAVNYISADPNMW